MINSFGKSGLSVVYLARTGSGKVIEFTESLQPPRPITEKWVIIVSVAVGCPVNCLFCDAGGKYLGNLTKEEIFEQIDFLVERYFPSRFIPSTKFKIQFARMGEPVFNKDVLLVLRNLPFRYDAKGLVPCLSSVAPKGGESFLAELIEIKESFYSRGNFQLQFSIHTTDDKVRDSLMPVKKWSLKEIAEYGERFYKKGDKKITLNFAVNGNFPVDPKVIKRYFSPDFFFLKITPINPTYRAKENGIFYPLGEEIEAGRDLAKIMAGEGYDVLLSVGELEENRIGSNCGQYVQAYLRHKEGTKVLVGPERSEFLKEGYKCEDYELSQRIPIDRKT